LPWIAVLLISTFWVLRLQLWATAPCLVFYLLVFFKSKYLFYRTM
jgi:hypothetical protein